MRWFTLEQLPEWLRKDVTGLPVTFIDGVLRYGIPEDNPIVGRVVEVTDEKDEEVRPIVIVELRPPFPDGDN